MLSITARVLMTRGCVTQKLFNRNVKYSPEHTCKIAASIVIMHYVVWYLCAFWLSLSTAARSTHDKTAENALRTCATCVNKEDLA